MKAKKYFFILFFLFAFLVNICAVEGFNKQIAKTQAEKTTINVSQPEKKITIESDRTNSNLYIYSILGELVFEKKISQPKEDIYLNVPNGYYIVKLNDFVQKIIIR